MSDWKEKTVQGLSSKQNLPQLKQNLGLKTSVLPQFFADYKKPKMSNERLTSSQI